MWIALALLAICGLQANALPPGKYAISTVIMHDSFLLLIIIF